jgi:hypothetical protein
MVGLINVATLTTPAAATIATSQGGNRCLQAARTHHAPALQTAERAENAEGKATSTVGTADSVESASPRNAALEGRRITGSRLAPVSSSNASSLAAASRG